MRAACDPPQRFYRLPFGPVSAREIVFQDPDLMIKSLLLILLSAALSIHYSDFESESAFNSILLPLLSPMTAPRRGFALFTSDYV